jgi:hypothetical protein
MQRLLAAVLISVATASGCTSGGGSPSESPSASTTQEPGSTRPPTPAIATPDEHFQSWLSGGGIKGAYSLWSSGMFGAGPPAGATRKERRALFEKWLRANDDVLRASWDRAQDLRAQADLRTAMAVALTYRADHGGFDGLTPSEAAAIDPALTFNDSETVVDEVTIGIANQGSVLLTTESRSGQALCMAYQNDSASLGTTDAATVAECYGGWP